MYHLDRRKTVRGQAVVAFSAVFSCAVAGAGIGFWVGKQAGVAQTNASNPIQGHGMTQNLATIPATSDPAQIEAITASLGDMQAELMRVNALGERVAGMAGLDRQEFDFRNPPPQGGPEGGPAQDYTIREIASELGSMVSLLKDRKRKLEILEEAIPGRELTAKSVPSGWPIRTGYISSNYGMRVHPIRHRAIFHQGVDFAAPSGSPVVAVADGVVAFSGRRHGYGNLIEIRHANGYSTRYGHNSSNAVHEGEQVRKGQVIGAVGSTGSATGPHVHFEVLKDGEHENPMQFTGSQAPGALFAGGHSSDPGNPG
ncbi:M23 family metallopeptidase [uncultured Thiodictyon sp.]|uniref:M23 family metallopeptidase n=1 Tax=uncultured Thiodictyon sp. TaxID=1846217 RepID=UPI0025ECCE21|nr:M23 family metallopeptidase [uncultured Thiodictyon sp.]